MTRVCTRGGAEGYSTSYMDPYGAMRTSNPMYRDPEESARLPLPVAMAPHPAYRHVSFFLPANHVICRSRMPAW